MADSVPEVAHLAIHLAEGCAKILKPLLRFLGRRSRRSPVVDLAAAVLLLVLPIAYVAAVVLAYFLSLILRYHNLAAPAPALSSSSATALVLLFMLVSAWLLLSALPLAAFFLFLDGAGKGGICPVFSSNMLS